MGKLPVHLGLSSTRERFRGPDPGRNPRIRGVFSPWHEQRPRKIAGPDRGICAERMTPRPESGKFAPELDRPARDPGRRRQFQAFQPCTPRMSRCRKQGLPLLFGRPGPRDALRLPSGGRRTPKTARFWTENGKDGQNPVSTRFARPARPPRFCGTSLPRSFPNGRIPNTLFSASAPRWRAASTRWCASRADRQEAAVREFRICGYGHDWAFARTLPHPEVKSAHTGRLRRAPVLRLFVAEISTQKLAARQSP